MPAKAAGRKDKTKTVAANDDAIEHELDDVPLTVTPLQSAILPPVFGWIAPCRRKLEMTGDYTEAT